jgi:2,3-bisphosphoglycerate-independent phosphoglycerate mutase
VPITKISDNDSIIFFNFRPERALQLTQLFVSPEVIAVAKKHNPLQNLFFVTMTKYYDQLPAHVAFPPILLKSTLPEVIANNKLSQFHIAESEKYAHVTSFLNGGVENKFSGEEWNIVDSPSNKASYADHPEMSALPLAERLVKKITNTDTNFFVANLANADMVGHTGNLKASIQAVKAIDKVLEQTSKATLAVDAALIISADHGNIEQVIDPKTGRIDKDHSTNPVPFVLVANEFRFEKEIEKSYSSLASEVPSGVISDIAPTILSLFGIEKPKEMEGANLLDLL